jgi:2-amino-4-hydroxy-6-hydroxymethyldihydropteridine diphosphokinase
METAYIAMGGNLPSQAGAPDATLTAALQPLGELGRIARRSSLYSTAPVGYADQPRFVNAVVALETELSPRHLLEELLRIERAFGRDRSNAVRNGPRTLDLDLLLYGDQVICEAGLEIPHARLAERAFVLAPLAEIASNVRVPARQMSVAELLHNLRNRFPSESDAIVPLESDDWRAGVVRQPGNAVRAGDANAHG